MDREASRHSRVGQSRIQLGRLVAMFHAPGRAMAGLKASPAVAPVLIATTLAGALQATAVSRAADLETAARQAWEEQRRRLPETISRNMSDAERAQGLDGARTTTRLSRNFAPVLGGLGGVLAPVAAAAFFLLLSGVLGSTTRYRVILSTVAHAWWPPAAVSAVLTAVVAVLSYPMATERMAEPLRTSLAAVVPQAGTAMAALASRFDLFLGWELALLTFGLALTLGVSRRRSFAMALSLWALVTIVAVGFAMLGRVLSMTIGAPPA